MHGCHSFGVCSGNVRVHRSRLYPTPLPFRPPLRTAVSPPSEGSPQLSLPLDPPLPEVAPDAVAPVPPSTPWMADRIEVGRIFRDFELLLNHLVFGPPPFLQPLVGQLGPSRKDAPADAATDARSDEAAPLARDPETSADAEPPAAARPSSVPGQRFAVTVSSGPSDASSGDSPRAGTSNAEGTWDVLEHTVRPMRERGVCGRDALLRELVMLTSAAYRDQGIGPRILLTAPPSASKTFLVTALGDCLDITVIQIDAGALVVEGWHGTSPQELLSRAMGTHPRAGAMRARGALLILDEVDKATRQEERDRHGSAVRRDRQDALLTLLWGGTPIHLPNGNDITTDRWIVVACGTFAGSAFSATHRAPTDAELIAWGMTPEFASRLTTRLAMPQRTLAEVIEVLREDRRGVVQAEHLAEAYGYALEIPEETLACLAVALRASPPALTLRGAAQQLTDAVMRRLLARGRAGIGETLLLAPDDLSLAAAPRGAAPPGDADARGDPIDVA